jgi:hypothetical protein
MGAAGGPALAEKPYAPHLLLATGLILLDPNIPLLVLNLFRR